jgi:hypothetical protein
MREFFKFRNSGCYCGHKTTWTSGRKNIKISAKGTKHFSEISIKKWFNENCSKLFKNDINWNV